MKTKIRQLTMLIMIAGALLLSGALLAGGAVQDLSREDCDRLIGGISLAYSGNCHMCIYNYNCRDSDTSCADWDYPAEGWEECDEEGNERDQIDHYKWWYCIKVTGAANCSTSDFGDCAYSYTCKEDPGSGECDKDTQAEIASRRHCDDKNGPHT